MSLWIILTVAIIVTIAFHFIGVYAGAKKTVWLMLALMWLAAIDIVTSEIKKEKYVEIEKLQGQYEDTDQLIKDAGDSISIYEMIEIKNSHINNKSKK